MNPGGLRADIDAGDDDVREAADVQPFANTLVTMSSPARRSRASSRSSGSRPVQAVRS